MIDHPATDAADATPCVEHHLEEACTFRWQAHPGRVQPAADSGPSEHAVDPAARARSDLAEVS